MTKQRKSQVPQEWEPPAPCSEQHHWGPAVPIHCDRPVTSLSWTSAPGETTQFGFPLGSSFLLMVQSSLTKKSCTASVGFAIYY